MLRVLATFHHIQSYLSLPGEGVGPAFWAALDAARTKIEGVLKATLTPLDYKTLVGDGSRDQDVLRHKLKPFPIYNSMPYPVTDLAAFIHNHKGVPKVYG
jgi:hypothetical protein